MIRNCLFLLLVLLVPASVGCTDGEAQKQRISAAEEAQLTDRAQSGDAQAAKQLKQILKMRAAMPPSEAGTTPDIPEEWQWSEGRLKHTIDLAQKGDLPSAHALYEYYGVWGDEVSFNRWEEWLVQRNDSTAMLSRVSERFSQAADLLDSDGRKLAKLKEADNLMRKWRAANDRGDGDEVTFHQKIIAEIERVKSAR
jgi:hypothetical protein